MWANSQVPTRNKQDRATGWGLLLYSILQDFKTTLWTPRQTTLVYPKAGATAMWHCSLCKGLGHMLKDWKTKAAAKDSAPSWIILSQTAAFPFPLTAADLRVGENDQAADEENSWEDHKEAVTSFFPLHVIEYLSWLEGERTIKQQAKTVHLHMLQEANEPDTIQSACR